MRRWCDVVVCDKELTHLVGESMGTFELIVIEHKQGLSHDQWLSDCWAYDVATDCDIGIWHMLTNIRTVTGVTSCMGESISYISACSGLRYRYLGSWVGLPKICVRTKVERMTLLPCTILITTSNNCLPLHGQKIRVIHRQVADIHPSRYSYFLTVNELWYMSFSIYQSELASYRTLGQQYIFGYYGHSVCYKDSMIDEWNPQQPGNC